MPMPVLLYKTTDSLEVGLNSITMISPEGADAYKKGAQTIKLATSGNKHAANLLIKLNYKSISIKRKFLRLYIVVK